MNRPRAQLDDEKDHEPDRAERAQRLDGKEVAGVECGPVAAQKLLPGSLSASFGRGLESCLGENTPHSSPTDLDVEAPKRVA